MVSQKRLDKRKTMNQTVERVFDVGVEASLLCFVGGMQQWDYEGKRNKDCHYPPVQLVLRAISWVLLCRVDYLRIFHVAHEQKFERKARH